MFVKEPLNDVNRADNKVFGGVDNFQATIFLSVKVGFWQFWEEFSLIVHRNILFFMVTYIF